MRFRVRNLLIADIPNEQNLFYPCAPDTVCGTITNSGPGGNTCMDATHCCYTGSSGGCAPTCAPTGCGRTCDDKTCVGYTASEVARGVRLDEEFVGMLRREVQEIQSKSKSAVYEAPEPESPEDLKLVEANLVAALEDVRKRMKK